MGGSAVRTTVRDIGQARCAATNHWSDCEFPSYIDRGYPAFRRSGYEDLDCMRVGDSPGDGL